MESVISAKRYAILPQKDARNEHEHFFSNSAHQKDAQYYYEHLFGFFGGYKFPKKARNDYEHFLGSKTPPSPNMILVVITSILSWN